MEAAETYDPFLQLAPNVTESAIEEEADGIIAGGHFETEKMSMPTSSKAEKSTASAKAEKV